MNITERKILIWLNSIGMGNSNIEKIINHFDDLSELWNCSHKEIYSIKNIRTKAKEQILSKRNNNELINLFNKIKINNTNIITIYDENYPTGLKKIYNNPKVLYLKGRDIESEISIAIVGSRKATAYGKWACEKFTKELVDMNVTIVSGMAAGIDTVAHRTALDNGGRTIGVLGNGIDIIYPKSNGVLHNEMEKENSIISEFPLETPPYHYNFPQRNRIIAGMSKGIVVIEAQEKSGSLITAHQGLDQGKDVFALPGNINSIFSGGTNKLIKDGARPLLDIDDIIEEIHELKERENSIKKNKLNYTDYSESEIKIIKILEKEPTHCDKIVYRTGMDIATINSILIILELKGIVKELSRSIFTIC